jgi:general secretion pathway protein D
MTMNRTQRPARPARHQRHLRQVAAGVAASLVLVHTPAVWAQKNGRSGNGTRSSEQQQAKVTLNFVNAEIDAVSRAIAAITGRQILVDPRVKGQMTLYSDEPVSTREALLNYLAALRGLGYTMVETGGLLKVVPEADAKLQTGTVAVDAVTRSGDQILTQVFRLQHENANNMVTVLRPLISPNNTINANPGNNSLVITDYADNLKRLAKIISAMDVPAATDVEVIPLKHAVAADLVPIIQRFADSSGTGTTPAAAPGAATTPGGIQVVADSRTNALLVRAPNAARLAVVRNAVERLDRPAGESPAGNIYVVYLRNADAARLATVLRAAYAAGQTTGTGTAGGALGGGTGGGLGTSTGTPSTIATSTTPGGAGTALGGSSTGSGMSTQATSPVNAAAGPSIGGFIQADPATNALIITAPEPVYRPLRAVIDQLDARRAQVYVESMIVKMDATKAAEFGFQWQGLLSNSNNGAGVYAGTNYSNGSGANLVNLSVAAATGGTSASSGLSLGSGLNIGLINRIAGTYTLGALARFLESETGANVLSTPNLVTLDNEEAKIVIGQNVPFVTGTYTTLNSGTGASNPFQTVERKDVGLTLRVRPQIGENGTVRMIIYQENSSVVAGTTSATNGPTTDKSSIETTVVVDDGQVLVLGGLLKDDYADGEDRVPGLSSIPVLGNLFKAQNRRRVKTNLLVFLRPIVMRTQADATQLSLDRYDAIRALQQANQPKPSVLVPVNGAPVLPDARRPEVPLTPAARSATPAPATPAASTPAAPAASTPTP